MKAKEYLKSKGLKNPSLDSGISGGGDAPRIYTSDIIEEYARIQIEKDRERVKASFEKTMTWGSKQIIDNTPINLD